MTLVSGHMLKSYYFASTGLKYITGIVSIFNMATKSFRTTYVICVIFLLDNKALSTGMGKHFLLRAGERLLWARGGQNLC